MGSQQVTVRLGPNEARINTEETLGLGYIYRVRGHDKAYTVAECGPRPTRDFSHRNCVSKDRHEALVKQLESAMTLTRRTTMSRVPQASPCLSIANPESPSLPANLGKRLRSVLDTETTVRSLQSKLRKTEWNARKVRHCETEAAEALNKAEEAKDQVRT